MIAVERVADAVVGALERGEGGRHYTIGGENLTWVEWLERLGELVGKRKRVISLPNSWARGAGWGMRLWHHLHGKESGLNPEAFMDVQTTNTFFDPGPSQTALGYGAHGLDAALEQTVKACLANEKSQPVQ
jgi:nucleoside-diphosphate-sugar epimerase